MDALLIAIVTWLSANMDLPANYDLPRVRYASPMEITYVRYGAFKPADKKKVAASQELLPADQRNSVVSVYDPEKHEVLLPTGWSPFTPAAQSILVHEMVHHLQY